MMTWMQEREQEWDACHKNDKLWGSGIMNMIVKTINGVAQGLEGREREKDLTMRTDGGGLEVTQPADITREEGQGECQQPQQQPKPEARLQLGAQPKPQPAPKLQSAPTPARW